MSLRGASGCQVNSMWRGGSHVVTDPRSTALCSASSPGHHCEKRSVKRRKASSTGHSTWTLWRMGFRASFSFPMVGSLLVCEIGECGQGIAPHRIDVSAQLLQAFGIETEIVTGAAAFFFHQTGGFEHAQVLRHSGPAYREAARQLSYGGRPAAQQ